MIALLYGSGLSRSELIGLKWADVDQSRGMLRIIGKGKKHRQVPVNKEVIRLLRQLRERRRMRDGLKLQAMLS